jgi:hypothetical protein
VQTGKIHKNSKIGHYDLICIILIDMHIEHPHAQFQQNSARDFTGKVKNMFPLPFQQKLNYSKSLTKLYSTPLVDASNIISSENAYNFQRS